MIESVLTIIALLHIFCDNCGALGYANEDGEIDCAKCKLTSLSSEIVTETGVIDPRKISSKTQASDLTRLTMTNNIAKLRKNFIQDIDCIYCQENTVTSELRQMDQSDEPEERFLICHSCGKSWRD